MLRSVLLLILLTTTSTAGFPFFSNDTTYHTLTVKGCGKSAVPKDSPDRIVGGRKVVRGELPWMVSLREKTSDGFEHVCGAAILNNNWVITAAHCLDSTSTRMYDIHVGLHKLSDEDDSRVRLHKLSKIIIHKKYNEKTYENDIALLKTAKPIDIEGSMGYVNGICLPKTKADSKGYASVSGWGHTKTDGENSNTLKVVEVAIIPREYCNEFYDEDPYDDFDEILETMICAGSKGKDSCQNDSGGPLIQYNSKGIATLIGVVSHGAGCGLKYYPGVYTKVASFLDWIDKNAV